MPKYLGTVVYDSDTSTWSVEVGLPGTATPPVAGDDIVSGTLTVTALLSTRTVDGEDRPIGDRGRRGDDTDDTDTDKATAKRGRTPVDTDSKAAKR